jgi:uncharacterized protein involved in exopolysaccharide biosynthesis
MKRADLAEREMQELNAKLRDSENQISRLQAELKSRPPERGGSAKDALTRPGDNLSHRVADEIATMQAEMADLRNRYADGHPEVQRLKAKLDEMRKILEAEQEKASRPDAPGK